MCSPDCALGLSLQGGVQWRGEGGFGWRGGGCHWWSSRGREKAAVEGWVGRCSPPSPCPVETQSRTNELLAGPLGKLLLTRPLVALLFQALSPSSFFFSLPLCPLLLLLVEKKKKTLARHISPLLISHSQPSFIARVTLFFPPSLSSRTTATSLSRLPFCAERNPLVAHLRFPPSGEILLFFP